MDLQQMLNNITNGNVDFIKEAAKCPKCKDTGREINGCVGDGQFQRFICSCTAGDIEAKKRAEKQK